MDREGLLSLSMFHTTLMIDRRWLFYNVNNLTEEALCSNSSSSSSSCYCAGVVVVVIVVIVIVVLIVVEVLKEL